MIVSNFFLKAVFDYVFSMNFRLRYYVNKNFICFSAKFVKNSSIFFHSKLSRFLFSILTKNRCGKINAIFLYYSNSKVL